MGTDELTGKYYYHRKTWVENELKRLAAGFGIDLLSYAIPGYANSGLLGFA